MSRLGHIEITETIVRFYVFLSQYLDRCLDETARRSLPESELQAHLAETRAKLMDIVAANRVVRNKLEQECERVLGLSAACLRAGEGRAKVTEQITAEREVLKHKTLALSDLLAVFRAL